MYINFHNKEAAIVAAWKEVQAVPHRSAVGNFKLEAQGLSMCPKCYYVTAENKAPIPNLQKACNTSIFNF
jgi:hypothetical protein